ncbi:MAG TPA: copper amine oxidase, partial [Lachnospiraceae bacterium]|nr:copper amine oxidase [Lachnospiraceae bacterium]
LDCSGYLGWAIYNTLETEDGEDGYVTFASHIAKDLSDLGYGEWTQDIAMPSEENDYVMKPGDVMSTNGHVWISLGTCDDNSIVILHSTPADSRTGQPGGGVEISAIGLSEDCEAYQIADRYMSEYFPEWYERYPVKLADPESYFTFEGDNAGRFTWEFGEDEDGFTDPDGIQDMSPADVLECLFS